MVFPSFEVLSGALLELGLAELPVGEAVQFERQVSLLKIPSGHGIGVPMQTVVADVR